MAVKVLNNTADFYGLVFTFLIFEVYLYILKLDAFIATII